MSFEDYVESACRSFRLTQMPFLVDTDQFWVALCCSVRVGSQPQVLGATLIPQHRFLRSFWLYAAMLWLFRLALDTSKVAFEIDKALQLHF